MKRVYFILIFILFFSNVLTVRADNQIEVGDVDSSEIHIVIFQGNRFDFGDEQQFKKFMKALKVYPVLIQKFETFFNIRIDVLEKNIQDSLKTGAQKQDEKLETLIRMMQKNQTAQGLEKQLDQAEADIEKLRQKISELEQQNQQNPNFKAVLKKAKRVLEKKQFNQYHRILNEFSTIKKRTVQSEQKEIAKTAALRAEEYGARLDYLNAIAQMAEAVEYDTRNSEYWNRYGLFFNAQAQYSEAINFFNKALAIDLRGLGIWHPKVAIRYNNLGLAWKAKGEDEKAIYFYSKALTIFEKKLGKDHPNTKIVRENLEALWGKSGGGKN